tara:strand:+ start:55 stop:735 length:681 start_codon:yes stop_codon:yes gene_type:complete
MSHPYKGIPKADWPKKGSPEAQALRQNFAAKTGTPPAMNQPANAFTVEAADVPYLPPEPKSVKANSESAPVAPIRNLFNGQMMKLSVVGRNGSKDDPIPGWRLYWFHDVGNNGTRIAQARMSGWEHVSNDEIALYDNLVPGNNDLGSNVRTVMNANSVPPTYGYLMKKPKALDEQHQAELQVVNDRIEQAIRKGTLGANPNDRRYAPGDIAGSSLPKIEISSANYR